MSKKLKLGLVGLGNMGSPHVSTLMQMDNVELVGVCDLIHEKADYFAKKAHTRAYYDCMDMMENSGLEAIQIAVPHYDHTTISVEAFRRGLHVLCEKPLAVHINDALKSNRAYEEALKQLGMDPAIEHVRDFAQIAAYGVMSTPALVVDGQVVSSGKVLKTEEVVEILKKVR